MTAEIDGRAVLVAGTGKAARQHVEAFKHFGCQVTVYSDTPERARQFASQYQVGVETDLGRGLSKGFPCLIVASTPDRNERLIRDDFQLVARY